MDKKQLLSDFSIKAEHQTEFLKILDKINICETKNISVCTEFLDPYISAKVRELMKYRYGYLSSKLFGGYDDAERVMLYLCADYEDSDYISYPLSLLKIKRPKKFNNITHRDVMGSVLSLGIVRDKLGDIIINDELIQIIVCEDIADYIRFNLDKIKNISVTPEYAELDELQIVETEYKSITGTVKSLRLDSIVGLGYNISRSSAMDDIKREKIKVNHVPTNSPSVQIKDGDLISYRGKGRMIFVGSSGVTKKDRIKVEVKKYL